MGYSTHSRIKDSLTIANDLGIHVDIIEDGESIGEHQTVPI